MPEFTANNKGLYFRKNFLFVNERESTCFLRADKAENTLVYGLKTVQKIKTVVSHFDNYF
jgi:hypothetical protein